MKLHCMHYVIVSIYVATSPASCRVEKYVHLSLIYQSLSALLLRSESWLSRLCVFIVLSCRPNSGQLLSQTVELLVHACSSSDQHIRLAASENLKKLIKVRQK